MKHFLFIAGILLSTGAFGQLDSNSLATVEKIQGYYVYILSKPLQDYEVIGTVTVGSTATNGYNERRKKMIRKLSKEYPKADGIIMDFAGGWDADVGTAIIFK